MMDISVEHARVRLPRRVPTDVSVHLFPVAHMQGMAESHLDIVSDAERTRAISSSAPPHRLLSYILLRLVLGARTGMNPRDVALNLGGPGTAIGVSGAAGPLYASLSRTSDFIAVSLAERQVGVDIEELQSFEQAVQLLSLLHPADQKRLGHWLARHRKHNFATAVTAAWTRKEATLKLLGTGLDRDPGLDEVGSRHRPLAPAGCRVAQLSVPCSRHQELAVAWRE